MSKRKIIYSVETSFTNYRDEHDEIIDQKTFESEKDAKKYADEQLKKRKAEAENDFPTGRFTINRFINGGGYIDEDDSRDYEYCISVNKVELVPDSEKKKKPPKHIYAREVADKVTKFEYKKYGLSDYYENNDGSIAIILNDHANSREAWRKEKYGKSKAVTTTDGRLIRIYTNPATIL